MRCQIEWAERVPVMSCGHVQENQKEVACQGYLPDFTRQTAIPSAAGMIVNSILLSLYSFLLSVLMEEVTLSVNYTTQQSCIKTQVQGVYCGVCDLSEEQGVVHNDEATGFHQNHEFLVIGVVALLVSISTQHQWQGKSIGVYQ